MKDLLIGAGIVALIICLNDEGHLTAIRDQAGKLIDQVTDENSDDSTVNTEDITEIEFIP